MIRCAVRLPRGTLPRCAMSACFNPALPPRRAPWPPGSGRSRETQIYGAPVGWLLSPHFTGEDAEVTGGITECLGALPPLPAHHPQNRLPGKGAGLPADTGPALCRRGLGVHLALTSQRLGAVSEAWRVPRSTAGFVVPSAHFAVWFCPSHVFDLGKQWLVCLVRFPVTWLHGWD